jgi:hypothetical protein
MHTTVCVMRRMGYTNLNARLQLGNLRYRRRILLNLNNVDHVRYLSTGMYAVLYGIRMYTKGITYVGKVWLSPR